MALRLATPSSSASSLEVLESPQDYAQRLSKAANYMSNLPDKLCLDSPSPLDGELEPGRLTEALTAAMNVAGFDPTHPKWGHVWRLLKLGCTSRGYVGTVPGVCVGQIDRADRKPIIEWTIPDTEEEWFEYEKKWGDRFRSGGRKEKASKYWKPRVAEAVAGPSSRISTSQAGSSKDDLLREKVATWQATITVNEEATQGSSIQEDADDARITQIREDGSKKVQGAEKRSEPLRARGSLAFNVVKRATGTKDKGKGKARDALPDPPEVALNKPKLAEIPKPPAKEAQVVVDEQSTREPPISAVVPAKSPLPQISDISESSFLPPSFPAQLETSTPPAVSARRKPSPIATRPYLSSPLSSQPPSQQLLPDVPEPERHATKRPRHSSPISSNMMDVSPDRLSYNAPPSKKARPALISSSSDDEPPPPSTPPPSTPPQPTPLLTNLILDDTPDAIPLVQSGLGNAKGLPVPTTPTRDTHELPTLTELLATSRRSRARPRPPSRKSKPGGASRQSRKSPEPKSEATVLVIEGRRTPSPCPTNRTRFSSPASGSTNDSPSAAFYRPRSPVSPLFTQNPGAFAPAFVSTQRPGAEDPFLGVGGNTGDNEANANVLSRAASGFFNMGYNSQFDVEGQVDRVSELLEHDIDYDGWLCDIPDTEGDGLAPLTHS